MSDCTGCQNLSESTHQEKQRNVSDCTGCQNLSKSTHQENREMCQKWTCLNQMCTGCQNLSKSTHQENREMCQIVQDVRTCLNQHTKLRQDVTCLNQHRANVSDCTGCQNLSKSTHQESWEMCQNLSKSTQRAEKCVRLYRMSEPV